MEDIAILAVGKMVSHALLAAKILEEEGIAVSVVNAYSVKPLDYDLLDDLSEKGYKIVTIEDNVINGLWLFGITVIYAIIIRIILKF